MACHDDKGQQTSAAVGVEKGPIVNGQTESGYPEIGALTAWFGNQYGGAFCTGTLIRPDWVLTAAHCVADADTTVSGTRFYVGANANNPNSGQFYRALEFKVHEGYDPQRLVNDIALVRLQTPVPGITPIAYNVVNLGPYEGDEAFYVGFGAVEGINESGSGVKRSTSFPISTVYSDVFVSDYQGTGTCFGDSGGPAILTINGSMAVVGVTSAGAACSGPNCDPCQTSTTSTRVDAFAAWIAGKLDDPPPDCRQNAAICGCPEACQQTDGTCNDDLCQTASCGDAYSCIANCGTDQNCQSQCYTNTTAEAQGQLDALFACLDQNCASATTDTEFAQCAQSKCADQVNACFGGGVTGSNTCEEVYNCFADCQDDACYQTCFDGGTAEAQGQINTMLSCFDAQCGTITDQNAWVTCVQDKCSDQITQCFGAPESCNLSGGDCDPGQACYPTTTDGLNGCFATAGKAVGAACDPSATDLECVDGAACVGADSGAGGVCERFCTSDAVCGAGSVCDLQVTGIAGVGLCGAAVAPCTDADGDGSCADVDCNDNDAAVHPGATETCNNRKDDNCNGQTDEGCTACTDADQDGFCADVDCNDNDPTINSQGSERCGDGTDNNCNGQVDENCGGCTDADSDGYCSNNDCNDGNANVHPTVAETCGNGVDDNCNGQVDENCSTDPNTNPTPQGGSSSSGCAGGELPAGFALAALALVIARRRRAV